MKARRIPVGFSLVELMIAMALASIIAAGAITMLVSDAQTSRLQINHVAAYTSGRFAFDFILADLRKAGYTNRAKVTQLVSGTNADGFAESDVLRIRYDASLVGNRDCVGNPISVVNPALNVVTNEYRVQNIDGVNVLTCNNSLLMPGVDGFQVLFGIDNSGDDVPDTYVKPSELIGSNVVTVQIAMLVASQNLIGEEATKQYQLLDVAGTLTDRRLRTLYTTTERIRNIDLDGVL